MKKLFIILSMCIACQVFSQNLQLTDVSSNFGSDANRILDQKILTSGRIVTVGKFSGGGFQPNPANSALTFTAQGISDGFIAVYESDGTYLWHHILSGTGEDAITAVEGLNSIYITGYITTTANVDMDPSASISNLYTTTTFKDGFVASYSETGSALNFAAKFEGTGQDTPQKLTLNGANLIIGGQFNNTIDLDGSAIVNNFTSAGAGGNFDFFIASLNATTGAYLNGYSAGEDNGNIGGNNNE